MSCNDQSNRQSKIVDDKEKTYVNPTPPTPTHTKEVNSRGGGGGERKSKKKKKILWQWTIILIVHENYACCHKNVV